MVEENLIDQTAVLPNVPAETTVVAPLLKLDLACGQSKAEGFTGVDFVAAPGVDIVHNFFEYPWPWADNSVDEARCSHFFEHIPGPDRPRFMEELYRVLKPGAGCMFITPHWSSVRSVQDFTHAWPPIAVETYYYFDRNWMEANKLTHGHYEAACKSNFEVRPAGQSLHPLWQSRHHEAQAFAATFYQNAIMDIIVLMVKRP